MHISSFMLHASASAHCVEMLANSGLSGVAAELDGPYVPQKRFFFLSGFPSRLGLFQHSPLDQSLILFPGKGGDSGKGIGRAPGVVFKRVQICSLQLVHTSNPRTDGPTQISRERNPPPFAAKQHLQTHEEPSASLTRPFRVFFLHLRQLLMVEAKTLRYKRKERKKDETTPLSFSYQVPCDALPGNRNFPVEEREGKANSATFRAFLPLARTPNIGFGSIPPMRNTFVLRQRLREYARKLQKVLPLYCKHQNGIDAFSIKKVFFCIFTPSSTTPPLRIHPFRFMFLCFYVRSVDAEDLTYFLSTCVNFEQYLPMSKINIFLLL